MQFPIPGAVPATNPTLMNQIPDNGPTAARQPTMRDVARQSGYHITTVSKALRDLPSIPEQTRRQIQAVAQTLGYERNPVYDALSRFRRDGDVSSAKPRIAYLENFGLGSGRPRPNHLEAVLNGGRAHARLLGYELEALAVGEDDRDSRSLTRHLAGNGITGVVIGYFQPGFSEIALNWDDYAVVKIASRHMEPDATVVCNDQLREVRLAFRRLTMLGYRRIGLAVGRADEDACGHRHTAGYLMEAALLPSEQHVPPLIFPYTMTEPDLSAMMGRWVRRNAIDAVLCNWGYVWDMLEHAGLDVPGTVGCACLCLCGKSRPGMAGVQPRLDLVGERAVSIVVAQLKSGERGLPNFPSSIYVQSSWQDGLSALPRT